MDNKLIELLGEDPIDTFLIVVKKIGVKKSFDSAIENNGGVVSEVFIKNMNVLMLYAADQTDFVIAKEIKECLEHYKIE